MFDVVLNPALQKFDTFANEAMNAPNGAQKSKIIRLSTKRTDGTVSAVKATNDSCYRISRPQPEQVQNNAARMGFFKAIAAQFGGAENIPPSVQEAMSRADFGGNVRFTQGAENQMANFNTGKPLRAYRIQQVMKAIKKELGISADTATNLVNRLLHVGDSEAAEDSMRTALQNLFKAALPPKWDRSRHFDTNKLTDVFGTADITQLQKQIMDPQVSPISSILALAKDGEYNEAADMIRSTLQDLENIFETRAKKQHIQRFVGIFVNILSNVALNNLSQGKEIATVGNFKYDLSGWTIAEHEGMALARQLGTTGDLASVKSGILARLSDYITANAGNTEALKTVIEQIANIGLDLSGDATVKDAVTELENGLQVVRDGNSLKDLEEKGKRNGVSDLLKGVCDELKKVKAELDAVEEYEFEDEDELAEPQGDGVKGDQPSVKVEETTAKKSDATKKTSLLIPAEGEEEIDTRTNHQNAADARISAVEIDTAKVEAGRSAEKVYAWLPVLNPEDENYAENKSKMKEDLAAFASELIGKGGNRLIEADLDARDRKFVADLQDAFSNVTEYPVALKLMRQYCDGIADARQKFLCRVKIDAFKARFDEKFEMDVKDQTIQLDDYVETLGREYGVLERTPKALVQFLTEKLSKVFPSFTYNNRGELPARLPEIAKNILAGGAARDRALTELQERFAERLTWDKGGTLRSETAQTVFTGICEILKTGLSPKQQAFVKSELKEYRDWYNEFLKTNLNPKTHKSIPPTINEIAHWKFKKAINKDYQEKVFRLFGNQLNPITAATEVPTTANPCRKDDILPLGNADGKGLPGLTKNMFGIGGFQIAADATWFGGTWVGGQEEGLLVDLPAFSIALLARQGYIEPCYTSGARIDESDPDAGDMMFSWKYTLDEKGERKLKSWLGYALPSFAFSTDGKPMDGDDVKMNWYVFTAASGFGYGQVNIDRGGFLETLRHREDEPLDTETKRTRADAFFDRMNELAAAPKPFLKEKELYGFGVEQGQTGKYKNGKWTPNGNGLRWGELVFLAHFYVGPDFNVFGERPDEEFLKLVDLVASGNYEKHLKIARKNYEKSLKYQTGLWANLFGKLNLDYLVCTTPGGTLFANPKETMIKRLTRSIARFGGNIQYYLHNYDADSPVKRYSNAFKNAAKSIKRKEKNVIRA